MPFVKGKSGNPGGRPKGLAAFVRAQTKDNREQVDFFVRLSRTLEEDTPAKQRVPGAELKDVMYAHSWLADRGSGKALERVQNFEGEGDPMDELTTRQLERLASLDTTTH